MADTRRLTARLDQPLRLDRFLADQLPDWSRTVLARLIEGGHVRVDGAPARPRTPVGRGEAVEVDLPDLDAPVLLAEDIPLTVLHRDDAVLVLDKPAGMTVHPAGGAGGGTLVNALLGACGDLPGDAARPGLVHRLDKGTSGVMVVALTARALEGLAGQFRRRSVEKEYLAVVWGRPAQDQGVVSLPLGRKPGHRTRQAVRMEGGRASQTEWRVLERYPGHAQVLARPRTGRTHQIRVHMTALGHPILCDADYGGGGPVTASELAGERSSPGERPVLARPFLHARRLVFDHPVSGLRMGFESPPPADLAATLDVLRRLAASQAPLPRRTSS